MTDAVDFPVVARVWCLYPDHWLKWDYVFGLRAWGLVVYGTIPSTLSALGVIKVLHSLVAQLDYYYLYLYWL
jgi:hypothetical protein